MPNDLLVKLNVGTSGCVMSPVRPVYHVGETIRLRKVIPTIACLLLRGFCWRLKEKYILRDFHPLVFFYGMGLTLFPAGIIFGLYLVWYRFFVGTVAATSALLAAFLIISGYKRCFLLCGLTWTIISISSRYHE